MSGCCILLTMAAGAGALLAALSAPARASPMGPALLALCSTSQQQQQQQRQRLSRPCTNHMRAVPAHMPQSATQLCCPQLSVMPAWPLHIVLLAQFTASTRGMRLTCATWILFPCKRAQHKTHPHSHPAQLPLQCASCYRVSTLHANSHRRSEINRTRLLQSSVLPQSTTDIQCRPLHDCC